MDFNTVGTVAGIVIAAVGLFLPSWLSASTDKRKEYRAAATHMQEKLLTEMKSISDGSYPFRSLKEGDLFKLLPHASNRSKKSLIKAFEMYVEAHQIAITKPWQNDNHSGPVFFPMSFIITNPAEVLEKMQPLKKCLSR